MKTLIGLALFMGLIFFISGVSATTYKSDVDNYYGFYRIIAVDSDTNTSSSKMPSYVNKTLNISVGDTIIWINDADPDEPLTIMSTEGLWGNRSAYLRWNYQRFNYTFTEPGTYNVYIREYHRLQQKIIVNPIYVPTQIPTTIPTVVPPSDLMTPTEEVPIEESSGFEIIAGITIISLTYIFRKKLY